MDIRLDYRPMLAEAIGEKRGITENEIQTVIPLAAKIVK